MIERIVSPERFQQAIDDMYEAFAEIDKKNHHLNLVHDPDSIKNALANQQLLRWRFPTWGSIGGNNYNGLLVCEISHNIKFNKKCLNELIWVSKNKACGTQLFDQAEKFAKQNEIEIMAFSGILRSPIFDKLSWFYTKKGFSRDSITFTKIL